MKRNTSFLHCIVLLSIIFLTIPFASAYSTLDITNTANVSPALVVHDERIERIIMNTTECPGYSFSAVGLICRSKEGIVGVYDRTGKKIFSADYFKKRKSIKPLTYSKSLVKEEQFDANLVERAINGQFDQVTETYEQEILNEEQNIFWPPDPVGWTFTGENAPSMFWEPDNWDDEYSDLHATVIFCHTGDRGAIQTTLDATGGQYVRVTTGLGLDEPLEIYLDDVLLGTITEPSSTTQFDISDRSWTTTSLLKIVAAGDQWSNNLVESISLMANPLEVPVAAFNGTPLSGVAPMEVVFADESKGVPASWDWSFGDGSNSTERNPSHTYVSAGMYNVGLTVVNAAGRNTTTRMSYVTVTERMPVANFTATPLSGPAPLTVQFSDTSSGEPTVWGWSFGDGISSDERNSSHTYSSAGTYTVNLTITNAVGSDTIVKTELVTVTEPERFTFSITEVFDPPGTDKEKTLGLFTTQNISRWLGDKAGWKPLPIKTWSSVTKSDFGTEGSGLNDATLHWHIGHGAIPDNYGYSALGLQDFPGSFLYPPDVEKKWGNKNKWVILHACYALSDERWGQALTTSHGVFGFTTPVYINPLLPSEFFHNAMDEKWTLYNSWKTATKKVFGGSTTVPSKFITDANGNVVGDYVNDTIPISAGVRFKTIEQFNNDHLPGYGTVEPDGNPMSNKSFPDTWNCSGKV